MLDSCSWSYCRTRFLTRTSFAPAERSSKQNYLSRFYTLSSRTARRTCFLLASSILVAFGTFAKDPPKRPRIRGIEGVTVLVSNISASREFFHGVSDPRRVCNFCEDVPSDSFFLFGRQHIKLEQLLATPASSYLAEVSFRTDDLQQLRKFLRAKGVEFEVRKTRGHAGQFGTITSLLVHDPDGHKIFFVELPQSFPGEWVLVDPDGMRPSITPIRIIHAGFVVHDRVAMDHFYKDILGFRLYWHGGMKDGVDDWVDMQVPDGTDWIEYMLNVPANADKRELGVMNHIALGVPDIHEAEKQLIKNGWKPGEKPQIGRDGKWQLNLYDPDDTRVELMEFTPVQKPCCSDYTGPHPRR
jgi:catechol 2,3-dioxygenase-like lactoylglutathione lyase family enzyme